ncbi:DNA endonuclease [Niveomyces insectorum RCEF 264]|uniref:Apurinic-apyrimidinic endonuclease 1 n=1 Tax=Niveomyces insectorum RCEF 264 TaxID=1081102 RepID=A0A167VH53_9HYPO|nr:DNA endonuclease [Niveomyces insectorum RCEF 264]
MAGARKAPQTKAATAAATIEEDTAAVPVKHERKTKAATVVTAKTAQVSVVGTTASTASPSPRRTLAKSTAKAVRTAATQIAGMASAASRKRKANEVKEEEEEGEEQQEEEEEETDEKADIISDEEGSEVDKAPKKRSRAPRKPAKKAKTAAKETKPASKEAAKSKKAAEDEVEPLAPRTNVHTLKKAMYIGAHVSSAGGVQNAVPNAVQIGGNAFALFLASQRKWQNPPLADDARDAFRARCAAHGYDAARYCLPHGSYLVNLAQPDPAKAEQALAHFVDDLRRCAALGIRLYNFHPGADVAGKGADTTRAAALARIAAAINSAHRATAPADVVTVIENMAGGGTTVGDRFEDLAAIIRQVDDQARVGVCLDTCHAFAAGYDLRTPAALAAVLAEFDRVVGLRYLRAVHLNDSKAPLGSRRDLHANIGTGCLGLRAFHALVNHDAFAGLPLVLETPIGRKGPDGKEVEDRQVWADEIKLLEGLIGANPETAAFKAQETKLQAQGAAERKRIQEQVDKKSSKDAKKIRTVSVVDMLREKHVVDVKRE